MWRFLLTVIGLISMATLVAGALGDLPTWRQDLPDMLARIRSMLTADAEGTSRARSPSTPPAIGPIQTQEDDQAARQLRALRARIASDPETLVDVREETEKARRELAALREQRLREQAMLDQMKQPAGDGREHVGHQVNPVPPSDVVPTVAGMPKGTESGAAPADSTTGSAASPVGALPSSGSSSDASPPGAPRPETTGAPGSRMDTKPGPRSDETLKSPVAQHLLDARSALATRQDATARRLLRLAQRQMTHPRSAGEARTDRDAPVTQVELAISLLDRGDADAALRAIDQALTASDGATSDTARRPRGEHRPGTR